MNTKYNELEEVYEVDLKNTSGAELLAIETPNKYVTYAGLERAVRNVLSKAKDYDKGLAGGYNGTFPLTAATKGNIYLLPATKKYYICIKDYSGSQLSAPNSNFEELSVYANRSKLDNLFSKRYSTSSNTFDFSGINWEYAIVGIAMQNSGGRVNRYIIRNQPENYLVYNISSDKVATIGVEVSSNKLTIFIHSSTYTVSFYFYDIVFCKFI